MLAMLSVIVNSIITTADFSVRMIGITTAMQLETVACTMVQVGGLTHAWQLTLMDATIRGVIVASQMESTGVPGIS